MSDDALELHAAPPAQAVRALQVARSAQGLLGLGAAAVLLHDVSAWWAPAPLVVSLLAWELSPWRRAAARPRLTAGAELTGSGPGSAIAIADVDAVQAWREPRHSRDLLEIVLWSGGTPSRVTTRIHPGAPTPGAVDVDALEVQVGGLPGWRGALPGAAGPTFEDPDAALWRHVRARAPASASHRRVARAWRGPSPLTDVTGAHVAPCDVRLILDTEHLTLDGVAPRVRAVARIQRTQAALVADGRRDQAAVIGVDLLAVELDGDVVLAIPSPVAAGLPARPDGAEVLHLHAVEGGPLLAELARAPGGEALQELLTSPSVLAATATSADDR